MNSENSINPVQDSMTDCFIPDLTNSSFESKNTNKQSIEDSIAIGGATKWVMEDYPEDKVYGTPQKK